MTQALATIAKAKVNVSRIVRHVDFMKYTTKMNT